METYTDYQKIEKSTKTRRILRNIFVYAMLVLWALMVLFPFYWMVLTSLKSYGTYNAEYIPKFFTLSPTLQNYADAFISVPLGRYLLNTLLFTAVTTALMLFVPRLPPLRSQGFHSEARTWFSHCFLPL